MSFLRFVKEFRATAGLPNPTQPTSPTTEQKTFCLAMIKEELDEYEVADQKDSNEGRMDALVDCAYFILSAGIAELGWGDFVNLSAPVLRPEKKVLFRLYEKLSQDFSPGLLNHLCNYCRVMGEELGDFHGAFVEVHSSNMTKFDTQKSHAKRTQRRYKKINVKTYIEKNTKFWVTRRESDGKILKSNLWQEPNLTPFLHPHKQQSNG